MKMTRDPFEKSSQPDAPIDLSLLSHIVNDAHLTGTFELEGNLFVRTATYLDRYISSLPSDTRVNEFILLQRRMKELVVNETRIEQIIVKYKRALKGITGVREGQSVKVELSSMAQELVAKFLNSDIKNGSLSLPGGWTDSAGGHAMLYLLKLTDKGLDFYIYNAGEGIQYHTQYSTSERELTSPVFVYHVPNPIDDVKLTNFILQLLMARVPNDLKEKGAPDFGAKKLYEEVFPQLYGVNKKTQLKRISNEPSHLHTGGQLSGTCSQAVLHQLLKEGFPDEKAYKQFIYKFKRYALDDYIRQIENVQDAGVQNQIKHALRTLGRILVTEGLFEDTLIQQEWAALKQHWRVLTPPAENKYQPTHINYRASVQTQLFINLGKQKSTLNSNEIVGCLQRQPKISLITGGTDLLEQIDNLHRQCLALINNAQSSDVVEGLERVFTNFPLPSKEQPFDTPLEFYQAITKDNQSEFYTQIERLRTVYMNACRTCGSKQILPRQLVVGLSVLSVLDYTQNRLCLWESSRTRLLKLSLHDQVIASVNRFFQNNMNNPWFATNNPLLDKRLQMIKSLYALQRPTLTTNVYRSLIATGALSLWYPLAQLEIVFHIVSFPFINQELGMVNSLLMYPFVFGNFTRNDIAWYSTIIDSEPVIKKLLEAQYEIPKTQLGNQIDGFLRLHGCKALYVLSSKRTSPLNLDPRFLPLIKKFEDQERLETGLFDTLFSACYDFGFTGKIQLDIDERQPDNHTRYTIKSFASNAPRYITDVSGQFHKHKYIFPRVEQPCDKALAIDHNAKDRISDNQIQLFTTDFIGSNPVANRQFFHLRRAPSLQIRETIHYFNYHLDKLSDRGNQIYMEANLFQPGLLLDELEGEHHDDILQRIDDFVGAGLQYHLAHDQCTQASLFFVRLAYLVYDYAARSESPQATSMLERLQHRLTGLLEVNKDNTSAIKHSLHQYQFLTAMSRLRQNPELDNNAREHLIAQALPSYFYMNSSNNPCVQLDKATLYDLDCSKFDFGHVIQACSPEFMKTMVLHHMEQLAQQDVIMNKDVSINIFLYHVMAGRRQYDVNVMKGLVFNDKGWSLAVTPHQVIEDVLKHYSDGDVPVMCFVNSNNSVYEIGVPEPSFRYITQDNQNSIEKKWTVNGLEQWYTLNVSKPVIEGLPQILRQKGTYFWTNQQSDTLLITEQQRPIYNYDAMTHTFKQLDVNGDENGYTLCLGQTWLHELFSMFDAYKFITVNTNQKPIGALERFRGLFGQAHDTHCFKIELSRYGLTIVAINEKGRWGFRLQNQPTHQLVTDTATGSCLKLPGLPDVAALIFEENTTKQRRCYIPVQAFVAVNKRALHSEFYHVEHDITARIAELIVKEELLTREEKTWKYTNSERYRIFPLDSNNNPQPETGSDALYLCYIYLCNHKPELAWAVLDYAATRLGGLSGSVEDISFLQMIVHELPYVVDGTYKAPIKTPAYIACKLKALAMLTRVLTPDRTIVFPNQSLDKNTPNGLYKNACLKKNQDFYHNLNTTIHRLYSRYQTMYQDITYGFNLPDEQRQQLLDYYYFNLPGVEPKAMGALGFEQKRLRLNMLIKENVALETEKQLNGKLPLAYEHRQQEIKAILEQEKAISGHHVDLVLRTVHYTIPRGCRQVVLPLEPPLMYNLTNVPTSGQLSRAIGVLNDNVDPAIFLSNFPIYFRLLITPSDRGLRKKLVDFCYLYLLTHRHVPLNKQNSTAYLCNIIYRIDCCFSLFLKGLSLISPLTDAVSSLLPQVPINFNTLFTMAEALPDPMIEIYEPCDQYSVVLPLNSQAWAQEMPVPGPLMIAKLSTRLNDFTFEKLLEQCQFEPAIKTEFQHHAQAYREQTKLFGSPPVDVINDFVAERQAGAEQGHALQAMQRIAKQLLSNKTNRETLQGKAQEFIKSLSDITTNRLKLALELANSGFEATPKEALRKELALRCEVRVSLTAKNMLALYFKADKALYALETGLPDDKINRLHDYLTSFVSLSVRQQALQRFVDNVGLLVNTSSASAMQLSTHELLTEDLVDYKTEPVLALFQYYETVLLRPQQMGAIKRLVNTTDGFSYAEVVEKIIMGGGKSKVILPLLAKSKATGTNLAVVEVPRGLFETNYADLSSTSGRLFDQKPVAFDFNRESNCSPQSLQFLYSRLIDVIVRKDYVITTGDAVQSLELKYLELLLQPAPVNKAEKLIWMQQVAGLDKLVNLFRTRADAVIDEVHQALLLKKKLNYTLGEGQSISSVVIQKTIALYDFFEKIPLINQPRSAETQDKSFADLLENNQLLIHDDDWRAAFQHMAHVLVTHPNSPLRPEIEQMKPSMTDEDNDQLCHYLMGTSANNTVDVPECILGCSVNVRNILARFKEQVSQLLPLTLRRNLNEHYGASRLHPDTDIAIPYSTNNEPSERSRFGNYREAMNFTIQMVLKEGLSSNRLHHYLRMLQEQASVDLIKTPQLLRIDNTPTGKLFHTWVPGYQLSHINLNDATAYAHVFNTQRFNKRLIYKILETEILPKQTIDSEILSSNAHTHVEIYRSSQGLTGTPDYHSTWSARLNFVKQNVAATNGFIIHLLEKKETLIRTVNYKDSLNTVLHDLLDGSQSVHAIMDICAAFRGKPNETVAYGLANYLRETKSPLRYVMFFNQENILCALNTKEGSKPIVLNFSDPNKIDSALDCGPAYRFSYFDQMHTLGTDLKQAASAKALALVDHETQLQNFLQGVMRMRGLADEQSLEIIVSSELGNGNFNALLNMMQQNQEHQLQRDNFAAAKSKMSNHVRANIMQRVLACSRVEDKQALIMAFKSCFVEQTADESDFFKHHGHISLMRETKTLLKEHRNRLLGLFANDPELAILKQGLDNIIKQALPLCQGNYLSTEGQHEGTEVEVQNQVELQQEQEQEQEQEQALENKNLKPFIYMPWLLSPGQQIYTPAAGFLSLSAICQCGGAEAPDFGEIYANSNYYKIYVGQKRFLGPYLKPVHALLFRKSGTGKLDCVILSQQEADQLAVKLKSNPQPDVWISNTGMTVLAGQPPADINQHARYQELIEQVRFFSGEFKLLLKGDISLNWLRKDTDAKMSFFKKELMACRETKSHDVSMLHQILSDQQLAFDYIIKNPSIDYTSPDWRNQVSKALSNDEIVRQHFVDILKMHSLKSITEAMSEQSIETLSTFLNSNQFKTNAALVKSVLDAADKNTCAKVIEMLSIMDGVSADVKQVIHEKTLNYNFYFNCLAGIALVAGGALLVAGILTINPVVAGAGAFIFAAGIGVLCTQNGFFGKAGAGPMGVEQVNHGLHPK